MPLELFANVNSSVQVGITFSAVVANEQTLSLPIAFATAKPKECPTASSERRSNLWLGKTEGSWLQSIQKGLRIYVVGAEQKALDVKDSSSVQTVGTRLTLTEMPR